MKRFILPTIFFYLCTFAAPAPVQAGVPLALIGAAAIGATMLSSSIGTYYAQNGAAPEYVSSTVNAVASASDALFQPGYLAVGPIALVTAASFPSISTTYLGKPASVGSQIGNIVQHAKNNESSYPEFNSLMVSHTSPGDCGLFGTGLGDVFLIGTQHITLTSNWTCGYANGDPAFDTYIGTSGGKFYYYRGGHIKRCDTQQPNSPMCMASYAGTTNPVTHPPSAGSLDYPSLKDALNPTLPAAIANEIRNILKNLPASQVTTAEGVPSSVDEAAPPALTQGAINDLLAQNTAAVAQAAAQAAADIAANTPNDAAAQIAAQQAALEAAKAAQEAAKTEEAEQEETFPPVASSGFAEPYDPGPYDIPERFTSFLNTVKSSGLFSFSSSFFNSLPGGGSPVYEIDAGQYGHHTIDLSQTLSTGLAVLKTILLACFGFLSIRAVIMKR